MRSLQSEIEQHGKRILQLVDQHPDSPFSKAGFYQRLMALSMRDEQFKLQLFRFVDVLPSLHGSREIVEHLEEYFADMRDGFAPFVHAGGNSTLILAPTGSGILNRESPRTIGLKR